MSTNGNIQTKEVFNERDDPQSVYGGVGLYHWLAGAGEKVPAWWSQARDERLRAFVKDSDHLSGTVNTLIETLSTIPFQVVAKDASVKSHLRQASQLTDILIEKTESHRITAEQGWTVGFGAFIQDYLTQDNGAFMVAEGPGKPDGALEGLPTKLIHLDSYRCQRTGHREYPIVYGDTDGKRYKIHRERLITMTSMVSPIAEMLGVGFCGASRVIHNAQVLMDIGQFKQEKLGSRPRRAIIVGEGVDDKGVKAIETAIRLSDEQMDSRGLKRYSVIPIIGLRQGGSMNLLDLNSVPDGFDELQSTQLGMAALALAFGVDLRQLAFAFGVAGQTKADAEVQHLKMRGKGPGFIVQQIRHRLNARFLPPHLEMLFDYQDDEQDLLNAQIRRERAERREKDLNGGVTTIRIEREQMVEAGELSQSQFDDLELEDGRLDDGLDILALFESDDPALVQLFAGIEPESITEADLPMIEERIRLTQSLILRVSISSQQKRLNQALAALNKLRGQLMIEPMLDTQPEVDEEPEDDQEETDEKENQRLIEMAELKGGLLPSLGPFRAKSLSSFRTSINGNIRGIWNGELSTFQFVDQMTSTIQRGFTQAWFAGAKECGINPDELTEVERRALEDQTNNQFQYLLGFAQDIEVNSKANGGQLAPHLDRGEMWINRYNETQNRGKAMACKNKKMKWVLGQAEHCRTCLNLSGKVKRASFWHERGILPQVAGATYLECRGYRCQCSLQITDDPVSRGPLPRLP